MFERKVKNITGISLEDNRLRVATVTFNSGKMKVLHLQTFDLITQVRKESKPEPEQESDFVTDLAEATSVFGLDDELGGSVKPKAPDQQEEDFDMSKDMNLDGMGESNATLMASILNSENPKSLTVGLNIPIGDTYYQVVSDINARKLGKKKVLSQLKERVNAFYGQVVNNDQVRYYVRADGTLFVASIGYSIESLNILDSALPFYQGKVVVRDIIPDEAILVGLASANYKLQDQQFTCIIHAEDTRTAVLFMQGNEIHTILPVINEGRSNPKFVRTVFSKILFEIDRGKIPTIDRVIMTSDTPDEKLGNYMREQLLDVEIEPFQFNPDIFELDESIEISQLSDYLRAIGVAWTMGTNTKSNFSGLSFVPERVQNRQQVLKLDWHGYVMLGIIAIYPLVFNYQYQDIKSSYENNERTIEILDAQIAETKEIADAVDQFMTDFTDYNARLALLDTLSSGTRKWSSTLAMMNESTQDIRSIWIRSVQSQGEGLLIQGSSLSRDRIPMISDSFENAIILSVQEREERVTVYDFTLLVTRIAADESIFNPPRPVYPVDSLQAVSDSLAVPQAGSDTTRTQQPGE
jgi:Tfp pilus assembly protein PilN